MKHILLIHIAIIVLSSCSNKELPSSSSDQEVAIAFGQLKARAAVSSADEILSFGVFADKNIGSEGTDGATQFTDYLFTNEWVSRADKSSSWGYDNTQYWVYDRMFHFFAYYPYVETGSVQGVSVPIRTTYNDEEVYQVAFETPNNADTDLLTAYVPVSTNRDDPDFDGFLESVDFSFTHALSKISVTVAKNGANSNDRIVVTSVSFSGVKKSGVYNCCRHTNTNTWVPFDATGTFSMNNLNIELTTGGVAVMGQDKGLLLMPQVITENTIKVSIKYSFYNYNEETGNYTYAYTNTVEVSLPNTIVNEWEPSKNYSYKLFLSAEANDILFGTPTITGWGSDKQVGGTLIIQ